MYKIKLKKNNKYKICACGHSKSLPFCDNNHREINKKNKIKYKSIKLISSNNTDIQISSKMWNKDNE